MIRTNLPRAVLVACLAVALGRGQQAVASATLPAQRQLADRQLPPLPLRAEGRWIVNARNERFKLACVSWSGAQERWFVPSGLWAAHRDDIARLAASTGWVNCVRLVWSTEMALRGSNGSATVPEEAISANPDLVGRGPLEVLDAVVASLAAMGLVVVLDNHSSDAIWCCSVTDGNGLWCGFY